MIGYGHWYLEKKLTESPNFCTIKGLLSTESRNRSKKEHLFLRCGE
jgi:hypothetical protein